MFFTQKAMLAVKSVSAEQRSAYLADLKRIHTDKTYKHTLVCNAILDNLEKQFNLDEEDLDAVELLLGAKFSLT